uniref:BESS domain-containing protein n=1 Tax=Glossina austeni TaxID=7395 RepID=A0A1A9VKN9_GLOAU
MTNAIIVANVETDGKEDEATATNSDNTEKQCVDEASDENQMNKEDNEVIEEIPSEESGKQTETVDNREEKTAGGREDDCCSDEVTLVETEEALKEPIEIDDDASSDEYYGAYRPDKGKTSTEALIASEDIVSACVSTEFVTCAEPMVKIAEGNFSTSNSYQTNLGKDLRDSLRESPMQNIEESEILDHDPMGLLEINERSEASSSTRTNADADDDDDGDEEEDGDSDSDSSNHYSNSSHSSNIQDWMAKYSWLLHEDTDEYYGYCLYCDAKLNVRSFSSVKQHSLSLYHKERSTNYLAFRDEEEKSGLIKPLIEVKQEFGTDSRIAALKLKRKSQVEALNNFNWRRWLQEYSWLKRDNSEGGTIGRCKYCHMRLNVEFRYLRERHQESSKHKDAEKHYNEGNAGKILQRKNSRESESDGDFEDCDEPDEDYDLNDEDFNAAKTNENKSLREQTSSLKWRELLESNLCRCIVCNSKMSRGSYRKHIVTKSHVKNVRDYLKAQKKRVPRGSTATPLKEEDRESNNSNQNKPSWSYYAKQHPWISGDPIDASIAYCKYCEKRFLYGHSSLKRITHENSAQHKVAEKSYNNEDVASAKNVQNDQEMDENENSDKGSECGSRHENEYNGNAENANEDEDAGQISSKSENNNKDDSDEDKNKDEENMSDNDENNDNKYKRVFRCTEEWLNLYPWCERYKKDPLNYYTCLYCKVVLNKRGSRGKHQSSSRHMMAEQAYWAKASNIKEVNEQNDDAANQYPWAVNLKASSKMYYCKYCRSRLSANYRKDKHEQSKLHQMNEKAYKSKEENRNSAVRKTIASDIDSVPAGNDKASVNQDAAPAPSSPAAITTQWRIRFPWLTYKRTELRSNYAFCKVCKQSIFARSAKHASRHQRTTKHLKLQALKRYQEKKKSMEGNLKQSEKKSAETAGDSQMNEEKDDDQKRIEPYKKHYPWIEKCSRKGYIRCRCCDDEIALRHLQLKIHHSSAAHKQLDSTMAEAKEAEKDEVSVTNVNTETTEDDKVVLFLEQDDTVRSDDDDLSEKCDHLEETADLESSRNSSNSHSTSKRKHRNGADGQAKRFKRSSNNKDFCDEHDNSTLVANLLNTPLTLANYLGPFIKQQLQQQNLSQDHSFLSSSLAGERDASINNSYDLFFKSVTETIKKLPVDLATEGKMKIMEIVCGLELKNFKRQQQEQEEKEPEREIVIIDETSDLNNSISSPPNQDNGDPILEQASDRSTTSNIASERQLNYHESVNTSDLSDCNKAKACASTHSTTTTNYKSLIGVMDKTGIHPIQIKATVPLSQMNKTLGNSATIRCIPLQSLTSQTTGTGTSNSETLQIKRVHVPTSAAPTHSIQRLGNTSAINSSPTTSTASNRKVFNYGSIQITQKETMPQTPAQNVNLESLPPQQKQYGSGNNNKPPGQKNIINLRLKSLLNGSPASSASPLSITTKQTSTPTSKHYQS